MSSTASGGIGAGAGEQLLARNMIDVHGAEAANVARGNARSAALAGQPAQAKSWTRVAGNQADRASRPHGPGNPVPAISEADSAQG